MGVSESLTLKTKLMERLRRSGSASTVPRSLPVLFFGDLLNARIATVGLNPSRQEYLDRKGVELNGQKRRFETLASLNATDRASLTDEQCELAIDTMRRYFAPNKPVYAWFRGLSRVVEGFGYSFQERTAAHLDLVQESTDPLWSELIARDKSEGTALLASDLCFLRWQIEAHALRALICTSRTVLDQVVKLTGAVVKDKGQFGGRLWTIAVAPVGFSQLAIAGWNIPLAQPPGLTREQQRELGQMLRQRVNGVGVSL
jgi:hypothetical protein